MGRAGGRGGYVSGCVVSGCVGALGRARLRPGHLLGWLLPEMSTEVGVVVALVLELCALAGIVFLWCLAVLNAGAGRGGGLLVYREMSHMHCFEPSEWSHSDISRGTWAGVTGGRTSGGQSGQNERLLRSVVSLGIREMSQMHHF